MLAPLSAVDSEAISSPSNQWPRPGTNRGTVAYVKTGSDYKGYADPGVNPPNPDEIDKAPYT